MDRQQSWQTPFTLEDYNDPTEPVVRMVLSPVVGGPIPGLVGACFGLVELMLQARVVCLVLHVPETIPWLAWLFAASDLLVEPLRWLAETLNLSWCACTPLLPDVEFAVAILAYGLLFSLLVALLKALLNH